MKGTTPLEEFSIGLKLTEIFHEARLDLAGVSQNGRGRDMGHDMSHFSGFFSPSAIDFSGRFGF